MIRPILLLVAKSPKHLSRSPLTREYLAAKARLRPPSFRQHELRDLHPHCVFSGVSVDVSSRDLTRNPNLARMALRQDASGPLFYMPAETGPHAGIMMVWPTKETVEKIDDDRFSRVSGLDIGKTRAEIAAIAKTIAKYEPLRLFVRYADRASAHEMLGGVDNVTIHVTENVFSLWARDTGPTFVKSRSGPVQNVWEEDDDPGINFETKSTCSESVGLLLNFNQWGRKLPPNMDAYTAATATQVLNKSAMLAPIIAEGGAIEVDGEGTMLATESSIINPNRNPGLDKATIERHLYTYLGVEKVIWIPGCRGADITDDHIDAMARFVSPGTVLLGRSADVHSNEDKLEGYEEAKEIISLATDAKGRSPKIVEVEEPDPAEVLGRDYLPDTGPSVAYANYLLVKDAVIMPAFGDAEADSKAKSTVESVFPERTEEQVKLRQLALQGGGIHCATQQILD